MSTKCNSYIQEYKSDEGFPKMMVANDKTVSWIYLWYHKYMALGEDLIHISFSHLTLWVQMSYESFAMATTHFVYIFLIPKLLFYDFSNSSHLQIICRILWNNFRVCSLITFPKENHFVKICNILMRA